MGSYDYLPDLQRLVSLVHLMIEIDSWHQRDCTLGRLRCGDFQCFTLELPWLGNSRSISCIPAGEYKITKYESSKHGEVLLLKDVPNRSYIEVHAGNYTSQIEGCILVGDSIKFLNNDKVPDVTNSRTTLQHLLELVGDQTVLSITRSRGCF